MQYGYFDDEAKEYVISRPDTPQSWSNYLGSTKYGAIITNNAGGYSYYRGAADVSVCLTLCQWINQALYLPHDHQSGITGRILATGGKTLEQYQSSCQHGRHIPY
jgi:cellobiose phosphorylase